MTDPDTTLTHILREATRIALPAADKARLREALSQYADTPMPARSRSGRIRSPYSTYVLRPFPLAACLLLFIALLGGGTAYAAQSALPGDALYPIKVGITEPVAEALAFSTLAKANVEADIATTRLSEMQRLAAKGTLSTTTAAMLSVSFVGHTEAANAKLAALVERDPAAAAEASASLDARIHADKDILSLLDAGDREAKPAVHAAVMLLSAPASSSSAEAASPASTTARESAVSDTFFAALTQSAQNALAHAQSAAAATTSEKNAKRSALGTNFVERAQAEVQTAASEMSRATTTLAHGDKGDAYGALMASLRSSVIAQAYAEAAKNAGRGAPSEDVSATTSTTTSVREQDVLHAAGE
jgi:hypothetical protein